MPMRVDSPAAKHWHFSRERCWSPTCPVSGACSSTLRSQSLSLRCRRPLPPRRVVAKATRARFLPDTCRRPACARCGTTACRRDASRAAARAAARPSGSRRAKASASSMATDAQRAVRAAEAGSGIAMTARAIPTLAAAPIGGGPRSDQRTARTRDAAARHVDAVRRAL